MLGPCLRPSWLFETQFKFDGLPERHTLWSSHNPSPWGVTASAFKLRRKMMSLNAPYFSETSLAGNCLKHVWPFAHPSQVLGLPGSHQMRRTVQVLASSAMTSFLFPTEDAPLKFQLRWKHWWFRSFRVWSCWWIDDWIRRRSPLTQVNSIHMMLCVYQSRFLVGHDFKRPR